MSGLTKNEQAEIAEARHKGMARYFPAIPNAEAQDVNTLRAARKFLKHAPAACALCAEGVAHEHGFWREQEAEESR